MSKYKVGDKVVMEITNKISVMEEPWYVLSNLNEAAESFSTYIEQARAEGQNEAWELARKIYILQEFGGYSTDELVEIFGTASMGEIFRYTYPEAAAKVAEWEKAKEKICVGDVVRFKENNSIEFCVTQTDCDGYLYGVWRNGLTYSGRNPELWEKTGRHIDIDSFLKQIGAE